MDTLHTQAHSRTHIPSQEMPIPAHRKIRTQCMHTHTRRCVARRGEGFEGLARHTSPEVLHQGGHGLSRQLGPPAILRPDLHYLPALRRRRVRRCRQARPSLRHREANPLCGGRRREGKGWPEGFGAAAPRGASFDSVVEKNGNAASFRTSSQTKT